MCDGSRPASSLVPTNRHAPPPLRRCARSSAFRNTPCMPLRPRRIPPGSRTMWMPIPPRPWRVVPITPPIACAWAKPGGSASAAKDAGSQVWRGRPIRKGSASCSSRQRQGNQGWLVWGEERISALIDWPDPVVLYGLLRHRIKYVRLLRRTASSPRAQGADRDGFRYSAQLALEGVPSQKPKHLVGEGTVGLDLGPST